MYPWPVGDFDYAMDEALDTAMDYLERTEQAVKFSQVQRVAAMAIVAAWKMGVRHRVRLANIAIKAVDRKNGAVFRRSKARLMMRHRDIEYSLVQGLGRHLWKWSATVADVVITGQAATKSEAVAEAERAIDRALDRKTCALCRRRAERIRLNPFGIHKVVCFCPGSAVGVELCLGSVAPGGV